MTTKSNKTVAGTTATTSTLCIFTLVILSTLSLQSESFLTHSFTTHRLNHINQNVVCPLQLKARKKIENNNSDDYNSQTDITSTSSRVGRTNRNNDRSQKQEMTRRTSLLTSYSFLSASLFLKPKPSNAGLVQFPCNYNLMNTYHFMRAGESLLESQDILSTNPLFLTNRDDALSDLGREQVQAACNDMLEHDVNPSVLKYSLASKSIDTANIIANEMLVCISNFLHTYW